MASSGWPLFPSQQGDSASYLGHAGRPQHHQTGVLRLVAGPAEPVGAMPAQLIQARARQRSAGDLQATTPEPAGQPADPGLPSDSSALPCSRVARRSFRHTRTACGLSRLAKPSMALLLASQGQSAACRPTGVVDSLCQQAKDSPATQTSTQYILKS